MMALLRRRWFWALAAVLAVGLLLIGAAGITLRSGPFEDWLKAVIIAEVDKATHETADLDRAWVTFAPPGLQIDGLSLAEDESGELIATADRIHAPVVLRGGSVKVGRLTIDRPWVSLHLDARGRLVEFRPDPDQPPRPPGKPLSSLPFVALDVTGGHLQLALPDGELSVTSFSVQPTDGALSEVAARVDLTWRDFADGTDLNLSGVVLGPERISIPDLAVDLAAVQLRGPLGLTLPGDLDGDLVIRSDLDTLSPLLTGPRYLEGRADAQVTLTGTVSDPVATIRATGQSLGYDAPGKVWPRIRYGVDEATVEATASLAGVTIDRLVAREEDGTVTATGHAGPVTQPDGSVRWELTEGHVVGESLSLAALLRAFSAAPNPWVDFAGDAEAHISGPLQPLELSGEFAANIADFSVRQGPVDVPASQRMLDIPAATLTGSLTLFKDHILLDGDELTAGRNRGRVVADIGFGPQGPLDLSFDLERADLRVLRPLGGSKLTGTGRLAGRLWGDFNRLQTRGRGTLNGFSVSGIPYADRLDATIASPDMKQLVLTEARGVRGQTRYLGNFSMDFSKRGLPMHTDVVIPSGRAEDLVSMFVDLGEVVTGDITDGSLVLDGPLNDLNGAADLEMSQVTLVGEPFETGRARGRLHSGTFTLDEITVRRGDSDELRLSGSVGRAWALDLTGTGTLALADLQALEGLDRSLTGRARVDLRVDNTLFEPAPHGTLVLDELRFADQSMPPSRVEAETTNGFLLAHGDLLGNSIDSDFSVGLWGDQPYALSAVFTDVPLDRLYPVAADGSPTTARVSGDLELWGTFGESPSPPELRARLPEVRLAWKDRSLQSDPDKPWRLSLTGSRWAVHDVTLSGSGSTLSLGATGEDEATLLTGTAKLDAEWLPAVVPGLTQSEGILGMRLASGGPTGRSSTFIDLKLDAPLMRHESLPAALEDVHARATLSPQEFLITHFESNVGGGRITGAAAQDSRLSDWFRPTPGEFPVGLIEADDWLPTRYDLHGQATDVQMQWVDDLPPAVGDARIAFDGPADALLLHANVDITDMAFTERIDWEDWVVALEEYLLVPAPPSDEPPWFGLDIDIHADRSIRLLNNVSDATASAELTMMGDTSRMGLLGDVTVEEGVVYVQDRAFDVERGELRFDDAFTWDPLLDFDLRADIQSRARQYRVNYRIAGPYSSWTSRTVSEPRLPQADINALLWFGVTADDLEDMGELTNAVGLAAADFVVKDFVQNDYLGLGLRDAGLWQRLPEIDLNTGVNLRGEYSSEPRVLIRQRWSPTLSTLAEINLVRDDLFARVDWRADDTLLLSAWYASRRREGYLLPFNGALGVDMRFVQDFD